MKLTKLCNIMSGAVVSKKDRNKNGGGIPVIQGSDLREDGTISEPEYTIPSFDGKANQVLNEQDVLLVSRGAHNRAVAIENTNAVGMIASNSFLVLRTLGSGRILPSFLAWYLNSWSGQQKLEQIRRGSNISYISKKNLMEVDIPLPDFETQKQIAATYSLLEKELQILNQIAEKRKNLIESQLFDHLNKTSTRRP